MPRRARKGCSPTNPLRQTWFGRPPAVWSKSRSALVLVQVAGPPAGREEQLSTPWGSQDFPACPRRVAPGLIELRLATWRRNCRRRWMLTQARPRSRSTVEIDVWKCMHGVTWLDFSSPEYVKRLECFLRETKQYWFRAKLLSLQISGSESSAGAYYTEQAGLRQSR